MKSSILISPICIIAVLFLSFNIKAEPNEESLKKFVKTLYEGYLSDESKSLESSEFRSFFDRGFVGSQVEIDITGEVDFNRLDFQSFKKSFEPYRMASGAKINFSVTDFNKVVIKGNTGVINMDMNFEISKNGNVLSKGEYTVSLTAKQRNGSDWKLTFINNVYVQSEVYAGKCLCDLYKGGENSYATYLTVPDGNRYETENHRFTVKGSGDNRIIEMDGSKAFSWKESNNTITHEDQTVASSVLQPTTGIANILKFLNKDKCQSVEIND